jgi:hypothetical protein
MAAGKCRLASNSLGTNCIASEEVTEISPPISFGEFNFFMSSALDNLLRVEGTEERLETGALRIRFTGDELFLRDGCDLGGEKDINSAGVDSLSESEIT